MAETPKAMMMHWAINDWNLSPESCRPEGTQQIDDKAVQTPFKDGKSIHLTFPEDNCPSRYRTLNSGSAGMSVAMTVLSVYCNHSVENMKLLYAMQKYGFLNF